jgi:hypothetical protein
VYAEHRLYLRRHLSLIKLLLVFKYDHQINNGLINGRAGILGLILIYCGMKAIERFCAQGLRSTVSDQTLGSRNPSSAPLINPYKTKRTLITVAARSKA